MKKLKPFIFLFSLISLLNSCKQDNKIPSDGGSDNSSLANKMEVIPNQFILVFKNDFILPTSLKINKANTRAEIALINEGYRKENIFKIDELLLSYGIDPSSVIDYYTDAISGVSLRVTEEKLSALRYDKNVSFVEQDKTITLPNDVVESIDGGDLRAQSTPCGITNAGGSADGSASTKWIWIVDTGIDLTHPDLNVETNSAYAKSL
ncbi:MAG: protease inhibitor I9 family protein [Saprospiraceae bacterium]|nr:protease inhibitor I9 family protein [Saprospiraceae bacterium]